MMSVRALPAVAAIVVFAGVLGVLPPSAASSVAPDALVETFEAANALYEAGRFSEAAECYRQLVEAGVEDATLYYNLGNASYKMDELGYAVLFYERALRLAPRNGDLRENLRLVRSQLRDRQFVSEGNRFVRAVIFLHHRLTASEMFLAASISYGIVCLLGVALVFRRRRSLTRFYRRVSVVSAGRLLGLSMTQDIVAAVMIVFVVFATTSVSAYTKIERQRSRRPAIVLVSEIPVFSGPNEDTTLQFKVHEGTKVWVDEARPEWTKIRLPGGLSGWVPNTSIARV